MKKFILMNYNTETLDEDIIEETQIEEKYYSVIQERAKLYSSKIKEGVIIIFEEGANGELLQKDSYSCFDSQC
ncbi:MAG: hypothetical protein ACRCW9_06390 [Cetobacterium sp.]